jgi:ABC-type methionine transport system ATPase subunit
MRRAVAYVRSKQHCCTPEFWWHLRLHEHPTNFATNRVDQLLSASILELLMLVGVQLFLHVVLFEHFTQLLRVIFARVVGLDHGGLVTIWCLRKRTVEDLRNQIFRCMHNGCGISTTNEKIINK